MNEELISYFSEQREYLDKKFDKVDERFEQVDQRFNKMELHIDAKIDSAVDSLARIIATTIAEPLERHIEDTRDYPTIRKDVSILKHDVSEIKKVLHLKT